MRIYFICVHPEQKFYVSDDYKKIQEIEEELTKKYGFMKNESVGLGISDHLDKLMTSIPKYMHDSKDLPKYYGTVWIAYKFSEDGKSCRYRVDSHFKTVKDRKDDGYTIKKFELTPYKEYMKRFKQ
jgi:hypothetical protein